MELVTDQTLQKKKIHELEEVAKETKMKSRGEKRIRKQERVKSSRGSITCNWSPQREKWGTENGNKYLKK